MPNARCARCNGLLKAKPWRRVGDGKMCFTPCYKRHLAAVHAVAAAAAAAAVTSAPAAASTPSSPATVPKQTRKRRAESDPGELAALQTRSHSTAAALLELSSSTAHAHPSPPPPMHEAHASPTSSTQCFQAILAAEQAELAARTPAQWARREYLMSVAPRCERCNFPRTGRKGWDQQTGCHTDKNCNLYRWRTIDAFC
jgi:hypothetical protein